MIRKGTAWHGKGCIPSSTPDMLSTFGALGGLHGQDGPHGQDSPSIPSGPNILSRRGFLSLAGGAAGALLLTSCFGGPTESEPSADPEIPEVKEPVEVFPDYMVLVNKENKLPDGWEEKLDIVSFTNEGGWTVEIERSAYEAFLALKEDLENGGVYIGLDNAYRSVATQERIREDNLQENGQDFVDSYVAVPGYSEHHTGLAMDLYLIIGGGVVYFDEDLFSDNDIWEKVHAKLGPHGFILRYPEGKEDITGYSYEAWHIRYIHSPFIASFIMGQGLTLEEYLQGREAKTHSA